MDPPPYGQTLRSVRQRRDSGGQSAVPESAGRSYGQTFRSVRQPSEGERHPALPNNGPLLPKGLTKPRRSSPRLQTFDYTGPYAYSITMNTDDAQPYLRNHRFIRFRIRTLGKEAATSSFEIIAYCFMPNHVHLLVQGLIESSCLKPFMKHFKQIIGFAFKQETGAALWHRSYRDHVLRLKEDIHGVAAYIWANPVRSGLIENAEDYPYSGPGERLLGEAGGVGDEAALGGQTLRSVRTDGSLSRG